MKDPEFYENILGLKTPWRVEAVKWDTESKSVEVKVKDQEGTLWASEAGARLPVYDHGERCWRHLDTCGFETRLVCRVPARPPTDLPIPLLLLGECRRRKARSRRCRCRGLASAAALRCATSGLRSRCGGPAAA